MQNKKTISLTAVKIIAFIGITTLVWYLITRYQASSLKLFTIEDVRPELEFAENNSVEVEQKPFLKSLPINTTDYSITYSSVKNKIVVIFDRQLETTAKGRQSYEQEINSRLNSIGINSGTIEIVWEIEK